MKKNLSLLKKLVKGAGLGGFAGYVASRASSSSHEASDNAISGAKYGALASVALIASPNIAKVVFRKIRGRIVPVKMSK